jgi:hypothetical protein
MAGEEAFASPGLDCLEIEPGVWISSGIYFTGNEIRGVHACDRQGSPKNRGKKLNEHIFDYVSSIMTPSDTSLWGRVNTQYSRTIHFQRLSQKQGIGQNSHKILTHHCIFAMIR